MFEAPDEVPFRLLRAWQKGFGRVINSEDVLINDIPHGEASALWERTTAALEDGIGKSAQPEAQRLFDIARSFSKKGREIFKDSTLAEIKAKDTEEVMSSIDLRGGHSATKRAKEALPRAHTHV